MTALSRAASLPGLVPALGRESDNVLPRDPRANIPDILRRAAILHRQQVIGLSRPSYLQNVRRRQLSGVYALATGGILGSQNSVCGRLVSVLLARSPADVMPRDATRRPTAAGVGYLSAFKRFGTVLILAHQNMRPDVVGVVAKHSIAFGITPKWPRKATLSDVVKCYAAKPLLDASSLSVSHHPYRQGPPFERLNEHHPHLSLGFAAQTSSWKRGATFFSHLAFSFSRSEPLWTTMSGCSPLSR